MRKQLSFVTLLLGVMLLVGCARSDNADLERARLEADEAHAAAEQAHADIEVAKALAIQTRDELTGTTKASPKVATGPRIWRDTEAEELCRTLDIDAVCFRYEGGWVAGWIDIEMDGKTTRWGEDEEIHRTAAELRIKEARGAKPSGTLIWVRRSEGANEAWDLVFKAALKTEKGEVRSDSKITLAPPNGPPQPTLTVKQRLVRGEASVVLKEDTEVTLVTLLNLGEKADQITRAVKLKCKLLK